ncbi:hypothetical protein CGI95_24810 [Vibrio parahaemolyticus]|nr:hypothetical protein CGI95_24810 [Vibrio parahaemolyticus]
MAFLVCVGFSVEVPCRNISIACFTLNWALCAKCANTSLLIN